MKLNSLYLINLFIYFSLLLTGSSEASPKDRTVDHVVAYYTHPEVIVEGPIRIGEVELQSDHAIFIGNKKQIKDLQNLATKILHDKEKSKGIKYGITLKLVFVDSKGISEKLYVDRKQNFEFRGYTGEYPNYKSQRIYGKISDKEFIELINLCNHLKNIIDFKHQQRRILEPKYITPPCDSNSEGNKDSMGDKCS